ncbi:MAG: hypothetical protein WCJ17_00840 [bacterium]
MMRLTHRAVLGVLCGVIACGSVMAREFRAPLLTQQHGYDFDPSEKAGWQITCDTDFYTRSAHRAFGAHGIATGELSTLFFNKDSFRLSQIFEDCLVPHNTEYYNPFMRIMTIQPRVEYSENGVAFSVGASRSVFNGLGKCGMRVTVPVRAIDTIRKDTGSRRDSQTEDVMKLQKNEATAALGFAYRLDFLEAMPKQNFSGSQVQYAVVEGDNRYIEIFGGDTRNQKAGAIYSPEGRTPRGTRVGVVQTAISETKTLPASLDGLDEDTIYGFEDGSFAGLADAASANVATRVANQNKKATVWVTSAHNPEGALDVGRYVADSATDTISNDMQDMVSTFNANTYEWLADHGYVFESSRQVGLGDVDVELFYNHAFGDRIVGGLSALVKVPTACGSASDENSYVGNPYRSHTGNGRHVEIGGGLHFDVEARSWAMIHVDGQYRFALSRSEKVCGTPHGSLIKNIGSAQEADVSWHSAVGNLDLHLCHPQTTDITGLIGYQFYFKRQDTVRYKVSTVDSWLGATYNTGTKDYTVENSTLLDNNLAAANTEQVAHRLKLGFTYHLSDWCSVSATGAITLAGQNIPKEMDMSVCMQVLL